MATLEEYYVGGLFLGPGNGVTDGSLPLIIIFALAGYKGNDIYKTTIPISLGDTNYDISISHLIAYAVLGS